MQIHSGGDSPPVTLVLLTWVKVNSNPRARLSFSRGVLPRIGAVRMTLVKIAAALLCSLGMTTLVKAAPQHTHAQHADQTSAAVRVPAQRWTPDAPLREGMHRAHVAVDALRLYEMGQMSAPLAADRAADVVAAVTYMFAHCKLAAEPDAALHSILAPLLGSAQTLKADPQHLEAVARMRAALAHYPQYFNDSGWDKPAPVESVMRHQP
ncbi:MAG: DnrO protein [Rhodanobacter sp.]